MKSTKVIVIACVVVSLAPAGTSVGVPGFIDVQTSGGEVQSQMVCMGPGFVNCSIAAALAAAGCFKGLCLSAEGGVVGAVTSVATHGGGAIGTVNQITPIGCTWPEAGGTGTAGGCLGGKGDIAFKCLKIEVEGNGYLTVRGPSAVDIPGILGPTAFATAEADCSLLNMSPSATRCPDPGTIEAAADGLRGQAHKLVEGEIKAINPDQAPEVAAFMINAFNLLEMEVSDAIDRWTMSCASGALSPNSVIEFPDRQVHAFLPLDI